MKTIEELKAKYEELVETLKDVDPAGHISDAVLSEAKFTVQNIEAPIIPFRDELFDEFSDAAYIELETMIINVKSLKNN